MRIFPAIKASSPFFTSTHAELLSRNFEVKAKNVAKFEDAEFIFVGDIHSDPILNKKFSWLVNTLARPKLDTILIEGKDGEESPEFPLDLMFNSFDVNLNVKGWDKNNTFIYQCCNNWEKTIDLIETCDLNNSSLDELKAMMQNIQELLRIPKSSQSLLEMRSLLTDLKSLHLFPKVLPAVEALINEVLPQYIQGLQEETVESEYRKKFKLACFLCLVACSSIVDMVILISEMISRNAAMVKNTLNAKATSEKVYIHAGSLHLFNSSSADSADLLHLFSSSKNYSDWFKIGQNMVKEGIRGKKYVILMPNTSTADLGEIEQGLSKTMWSNVATTLKEIAKNIALGCLAIKIKHLAQAFFSFESPRIITNYLPSDGISLLSFTAIKTLYENGFIPSIISCLNSSMPKYAWKELHELESRQNKLKEKLVNT